jgi:hypothetical protein
MRIRGKLFIPTESKKIKALFLIWIMGLIVIFLGLLIFLQSAIAGVALMATAITAVPFVIKTLIRD